MGLSREAIGAQEHPRQSKLPILSGSSLRAAIIRVPHRVGPRRLTTAMQSLKAMRGGLLAS